MKKKIFTIILIGLISLILFGCSANVDYGFSYAPNEDGTYGITQSVVVAIDKSAIILAGKTTDEFNDTFVSLCNNYIMYLKNSFNYAILKERDEELENGFSQKIKNLAGEEATVQKLFDYVNLHMKPAEFKKAGEDSYFLVGFYQNFDTIAAYRYFWEMLDPESDGSETDDGQVIDERFYQKTIYTQHTVFNGFTEENFDNLDNQSKHIVTTMKNFFNNQYDLNDKDLTYSFSLASPQAHFYTDSDAVYEDSETGNKVYVWQFSTDDLKTEDGDLITMYTIRYRTTSWYQLAIYLTIILGVGLLLISNIIDSNKKSTQSTQK